MNLPTWLHHVQRSWFVRRPSTGARRRGQRRKAARRAQLQVESPAEPAKDPSARTWYRRWTLGFFRREAEVLMGRGDQSSHHQETKDTPKKP
jgi:hypothetical protein